MSPRGRKWRFCRPFDGVEFYKPQGIPMAGLEIVELGQDEFEAMRFCDHDDMDQEEAAKKMNISRGTVQRLLYSGRKKIIDVFLNGTALAKILITNMSNQLSNPVIFPSLSNGEI